MTNNTHVLFPTKKAAAEHQRRVTATAIEGEEEKHILADRYKTKMCKNFVAKGECPYEVRCMFAHGEKELRTSADNVRDGLISEEAIKAFQRQQNQSKRRAAYAAAREENERVAAANQQQDVYVDAEEENVEAYYHHHNHHHSHQHEIAAAAPQFIPLEQPQQQAGFYRHNPYAFDIIPAQAREYPVYEEMPEVEGYWYEEAMPIAEEDYFPSSEMTAQQQQQYHPSHYHSKMYASASAGSFSEDAAYGQSDASEFASYQPKAHCTAAELPSFSDEAPMVLEP